MWLLYHLLIFVRRGINPRTIVRPEELCQWKIPMTPSGIDLAVFRFVAQCGVRQVDCPIATQSLIIALKSECIGCIWASHIWLLDAEKLNFYVQVCRYTGMSDSPWDCAWRCDIWGRRGRSSGAGLAVGATPSSVGAFASLHRTHLPKKDDPSQRRSGGRGGGVWMFNPHPRNSDVLKVLSRIPSSMENTSVTT
jgi:hypothetical protein